MKHAPVRPETCSHIAWESDLDELAEPIIEVAQRERRDGALVELSGGCVAIVINDYGGRAAVELELQIICGGANKPYADLESGDVVRVVVRRGHTRITLSV